MKNRRLFWFIFALLTILILLLALQPAAVRASSGQKSDATTVETVIFKVINKTEGPVTITLQGPKTYYLNVPVGTSKHDLLPGNYAYSYVAYGTYTEGSQEIRKNGVQLRIASQSLRVRINNKTGLPLTVSLQGPQILTVNVSPGKTKIDVWKGTYRYSYVAYGLYNTDTVEFTSNGAELVLNKLTARLKIENKSGAQVNLSLVGTRAYNLALPTGTTKVDVLKGKYTYSYLDHGVYETGEINIQGEQGTLTLTKNVATLKITNKSGSDLQISLQGKLPYFLIAASGSSKHEIRRGSYEYNYYACGKWQSGELQVNKNTIELKIASCQASTSGDVKVVIQNDTFGAVTLHLTGPKEYWFTLPTGKSTIQVVKGKYDFTAWGCGGASSSGTKNINSKYVWRFWCY